MVFVFFVQVVTCKGVCLFAKLSHFFPCFGIPEWSVTRIVLLFCHVSRPRWGFGQSPLCEIKTLINFNFFAKVLSSALSLTLVHQELLEGLEGNLLFL